MSITVAPASIDLFDDVTAVLGSTACWCAYYRMSAGEYGRVSVDQLERAIRDRRNLLTRRLEGNVAPGILAYADGVPVGWCGIGPRSEFARLKRSRTIPSIDDRAVWSIVCLLVRTGHRRNGVAAALVSGAVEYARRMRAPAIEAYPVDCGGSRIQAAAAHVGTASMFEAAGFSRKVETGARSGNLARWIYSLDLNE